MKLSIEWIRDYVDLAHDLSAQEIMHDLTLATVEVERAEDSGAGLERVVVARIVSAEPLGDGNATLARLEVGDGSPLQVVCTGTGIFPGTDTILALPGARIREVGGGEATVGRREVGGHRSEGLICRPEEVGLENVLLSRGSGAIADLSELGADPGTGLAKAIGWDDIILDIDNKSLTNRPDLWCHHGMARELAAIYGLPLRSPELATTGWTRADLLGEVDPALCRRFAALRVDDVVIEPSPLWLRSRLARIGLRPIDVVVDLTNYVMLDVGQPSHVYDRARLHLPLGVRRARAGEHLTLLDASRHELSAVNALITDDDAPVSAAGVMGGASSMIEPGTTSVIVEAANFDPLVTRRSANALGIRSEASARFEKAIDTQRVDLGISRFAALVDQCLPQARITGYDLRQNSDTETARISVDVEFLLSRLGRQVGADEVVDRLSSVGFEVDCSGGLLNVTTPSWRSTGDVSIPDDLIEEVARLHGYENFIPTAARIELSAPTTSRVRDVERNVKEMLAGPCGMQEVVLYPWVRDRYLIAAGYDPHLGVRLADPPGPDQATLQPSLVPGLLECIESNLRFESAFRVFACDDVYGTEDIPAAETGEKLPPQRRQVAGAFVGRDLQQLIREARGVLDALFRGVHLGAYRAEPAGRAPWAARGAQLTITNAEGEIGSLAVISERARNRAGLKRVEVVLFALSLDALRPFPTRENDYVPPPLYQQTEKDFSVVFPRAVKWSDVVGCLTGVDPLIISLNFVDAYEGPGVPDGHRSITLRATLGAKDHTLDGAEIENASRRLLERLKQALSGTLRA